jgi:hypothetical protein
MINTKGLWESRSRQNKIQQISIIKDPQRTKTGETTISLTTVQQATTVSTAAKPTALAAKGAQLEKVLIAREVVTGWQPN